MLEFDLCLRSFQFGSLGAIVHAPPKVVLCRAFNKLARGDFRNSERKAAARSVWVFRAGCVGRRSRCPGRLHSARAFGGSSKASDLQPERRRLRLVSQLFRRPDEDAAVSAAPRTRDRPGRSARRACRRCTGARPPSFRTGAAWLHFSARRERATREVVESVKLANGPQPTAPAAARRRRHCVLTAKERSGSARRG